MNKTPKTNQKVSAPSEAVRVKLEQLRKEASEIGREDVPDDGPDGFEMPDGTETWEGSYSSPKPTQPKQSKERDTADQVIIAPMSQPKADAPAEVRDDQPQFIQGHEPLRRGTSVITGSGYNGSVEEQYSGSLYNIRLASGGICTEDFRVTSRIVRTDPDQILDDSKQLAPAAPQPSKAQAPLGAPAKELEEHIRGNRAESEARQRGRAARRKDGDGAKLASQVVANPYTMHPEREEWYAGYSLEDERIGLGLKQPQPAKAAQSLDRHVGLAALDAMEAELERVKAMLDQTKHELKQEQSACETVCRKYELLEQERDGLLAACKQIFTVVDTEGTTIHLRYDAACRMAKAAIAAAEGRAS